jgi:hypothetical protein
MTPRFGRAVADRKKPARRKIHFEHSGKVWLYTGP